jgi:U6 snRNA-associated Sm-like protein LSm7
LSKYVDKKIKVKFAGGREGSSISLVVLNGAVVGTLKGWDMLVNLVLDDAEEFLRGTERHYCANLLTLSLRRCAE